MIRAIAMAGLLAVTLAACHNGGSAGDSAPGGIVATKRAPVEGPGACGVRDAWVVTEVSGVALSRPAIMTMETARALNTWVKRTAIPAVGRRGGGLSELTVAAHYACRTRNNRPGAKLSQHALGRAIDISSIVMKDGSRVSVLRGWGRGADGRLLAQLHRGACGPFKTVLGPNSDRYHQDHFHFDIERHRGGSAYCR